MGRLPWLLLALAVSACSRHPTYGTPTPRDSTPADDTPPPKKPWVSPDE
jgi:hypothetical protein